MFLLLISCGLNLWILCFLLLVMFWGMKLLLYRVVLAILAVNLKVDLVDLLCLYDNLIVVGLVLSCNILVRISMQRLSIWSSIWSVLKRVDVFLIAVYDPKESLEVVLEFISYRYLVRM